MDFTYEDFLALTLIYTANASEGISELEYSKIVERVGGDHYDKAFAYFETASDIEIIEKIDDLANEFVRDEDKKEQFREDITTLVCKDVDCTKVGEQIVRLIMKLL